MYIFILRVNLYFFPNYVLGRVLSSQFWNLKQKVVHLYHSTRLLQQPQISDQPMGSGFLHSAGGGSPILSLVDRTCSYMQ